MPCALVVFPLLVSAGCLVTQRLDSAPPPPGFKNTPPRIDVTSVIPAENIVGLDEAGCPTTMQFSVGRVIDPDAIILCYPDAGVNPQLFEARFFLTRLPPLETSAIGAIPPMAARPVRGLAPLTGASPGGGIDCDVVQQASENAFSLSTQDLPPGNSALVEIVVSDSFSAQNRQPNPGYGIDSYSWVVRNVACP